MIFKKGGLMKRLIKSYEYGNSSPIPILVKDIENKICNDDINDIQYNSTIDRTFGFEELYDCAEWNLRQSRRHKNVKKRK